VESLLNWAQSELAQVINTSLTPEISPFVLCDRAEQGAKTQGFKTFSLTFSEGKGLSSSMS
jgi:hypothetical protein